jgi:transposase
MQELKQWVGIDVCKRWLDVHLRPPATSFRVANNAGGIAELATHLSAPGGVRSSHSRIHGRV